MIPSRFVTMDAFPFTPNKKIDRKMLPAPDQSASASSTNHEPPATDLQERIAEIWQELLNVNNVGVKDNFFDLGGHSLLTVQVHRRLGELVDHQLSITDMFRYPTIQSLAEVLNRKAGEQHHRADQQTGIRRADKRRAARRRPPRQNG